jgi:SagB-type dehydrogenase family enzyme
MKKHFFFITVVLMSINLFAQESNDIQLPVATKTGGKPLMETLNKRSSDRSFSTKELSLQELSDLLWAANGINRPESGKRTAPTAMNWQDTEVYAILRSGIYKYNPKDQKLELIRSGNFMKYAGKQDFVENAALNLVIISDTSKMKNASKEDMLLYAGIHAGAIVQNIYLYCASAGFNTVTRRYVDITELSKVMGLSPEKLIVITQTIGLKP